MLDRKNVILIDFNNLAYRTYFVKDVHQDEENPNIKLWRFLLIDNIYKSLYKINNVRSIILAIDDYISWRKVYWGRYKESRKVHRATQSRVDWQFFFKSMNELIDDIKDGLPFIPLKVQSAEADDIIAVICMDKTEDDYIIISNDEDFLQLTGLPNVMLYCPNKERYLRTEKPEDFVTKLCLMGQSKDDIFNIKTPLDWPVGTRKPIFGERMLSKVLDEGVEKWLKENNLEERYKANQMLVDFKKIPQIIRKRILEAYETYELPSPDNMYTFFNKNKMQSYIEDYHKVESRLLQLY